MEGESSSSSKMPNVKNAFPPKQLMAVETDLACESKGTSGKPCKFFQCGGPRGGGAWKKCFLGNNCGDLHLMPKVPVKVAFVSGQVSQLSTCGAESVDAFNNIGGLGDDQGPALNPVALTGLELSEKASLSDEKCLEEEKWGDVRRSSDMASALVTIPVLFTNLSTGIIHKVCVYFKPGRCTQGTGCHHLHLVPWVPGESTTPPLTPASAIPGAVPSGFHCQSIGSTGERCPYFHGNSGSCCNMEMCLRMHLVTKTKAKELSEREKNNENAKLDVTNTDPYESWSKRSNNSFWSQSKKRSRTQEKSGSGDASRILNRSRTRKRSRTPNRSRIVKRSRTQNRSRTRKRSRTPNTSRIPKRSRRSRTKEGSRTNQKCRSEERIWNENICMSQERSEKQEFGMAEENIRTCNKNGTDTDIVPQIKEEDKDDIVGRPTDVAATAKFVEVNENFMNISSKDKYIDHSLNIKKEESVTEEMEAVIVSEELAEVGWHSLETLNTQVMEKAGEEERPRDAATKDLRPNSPIAHLTLPLYTNAPNTDLPISPSFPLPSKDLVEGRIPTVLALEPTPTISSPMLRVINLPPEATRDNLRVLFSQYGQVKKIQVRQPL